MLKPKSIKMTYKNIMLAIYGFFLFLLPLIFVTNTNELFEFPKTLFIYFCGSFIIFLFLLHHILYPRALRMPHLLVVGWLVIYVISTIFSSHLQTSIWGYYTRFNGGLMSMLILFGVYFAAINLFNKNDICILFIASLFSLIPVSLYAIIQHFDFVNQGVESLRIYSTFGQPNWVAAYIATLLPMCLYLFLKSSKRYEHVLFWALVFILAFAGLWFTYSMSGLLGFGLGVLAVLFLNLPELKKNIPELTILFVLCAVIALFNLGFFERRVNDLFIDAKRFISYHFTVYAQSEYSVSDAGFIRKGMWQGTLNLIFSSPKVILIGTGPETFPYTFQPHRVLELNYSSEWDFILNKPHNYFLEIFSQLGVFAVIIYVGIIIRFIRTRDNFLVPAILALSVTNFFGWPTAALSALFWIFLAYVDLTIEVEA